MSHNSGAAVCCTVRRVALTPADIAGAGKDDPARPESANPTDTMIGYSRLPVSGQNLNLRSGALTDVGCIRVLASKLPCKTAVPSSPRAWITSAQATPWSWRGVGAMPRLPGPCQGG